MILPYNNSRQCIPATRCILCLHTKCQTLKSFKSLKKKHLSYFKETFVLLVFNVMNALEGNAATETAHPPCLLLLAHAHMIFSNNLLPGCYFDQPCLLFFLTSLWGTCSSAQFGKKRFTMSQVTCLMTR